MQRGPDGEAGKGRGRDGGEERVVCGEGAGVVNARAAAGDQSVGREVGRPVAGEVDEGAVRDEADLVG